MSTLTPHLWFDTQAREAAEFYVSVFPESEVGTVTTLHATPSGDCDVVDFRVWGQDFLAISGGLNFTINPSVSFLVNVDPSRLDDPQGLLDRLWGRLSEGGTELMPLGAYPFSKRYGWIQDRFGVSWQLMLTDPDGSPRPPVIPMLLFVGDVAGQCEQACDLYRGLFVDSERGPLVRYPEGMAPETPGTVMFSDLRLGDTWIAAMDSARDQRFLFTEAVSFVVHCADQAEIDHFWNGLSAVPEAERCGWLKDAYGLSWQIVPADMRDMMSRGTPEQLERVTQALLPMTKLDIAAIRAAYDG